MIRKMVAVVAMTVVSLTGVTLCSQAPADAWVWSGSAQLQGRSSCGSSPTTWVWVSAPNGESGWATSGSGRYYRSFSRVPSGGMWVRISYGNRTFSCHDSVFVRRPLVGTGLTVNLAKIVPNGG